MRFAIKRLFACCATAGAMLFAAAAGGQVIKGTPSRSVAKPATKPVNANDAQSLLDREITIHVLNRAAFGARPGEVAKVHEIGWKNWILQQLEPEKIDDAKIEAQIKEEYPSLRMTMDQLWSEYHPPYKGMGPTPEEQRKRNELRYKVRRELTDSILYRAVNSERQLNEVIVEFWRNHFAIDQNKDDVAYLANHYEEEVIRRHAFGRFEDMLLASARHPAMLIFLDNAISQRPLTPQEQARLERAREYGQKTRSVAALERHPGLNENYARELMELHTLGVDNIYTQNDVTEMARVLTGWSIGKDEEGRYGFMFRKHYNDTLPKRILGAYIQGNGGYEEGEMVIRSLAKYTGTAQFISWKLCRYFVNDEPPVALVDRVAATFRKTGGNLRAVYKEILLSPEFAKEANFKAKFKTPFEFVVSAIRATGATVEDLDMTHNALRRMGMPIYQCDDPTGYYDQAEAWLDPGVMVHRWEFAMRIARNKLTGVRVSDKFYDQITNDDPQVMKTKLIDQVVPNGIDEKTSEFLDDEIEKNSGGKQGGQWLLGLLLGSPAFQQQ